PLTFDASLREILWPLTVGASLVAGRPHALRDGDSLGAAIAEHGATALNVVPSVLTALLATTDRSWTASLRLVLSGGESLPLRLAASLRDAAGCTVINLYGPTEATIDVCAGPVDPEGDEGPYASLGLPLDDVEVLIRNASGACPVSTLGEICIQGPT